MWEAGGSLYCTSGQAVTKWKTVFNLLNMTQYYWKTMPLIGTVPKNVLKQIITIMTVNSYSSP